MLHPGVGLVSECRVYLLTAIDNSDFHKSVILALDNCASYVGRLEQL